MAAKKSKSKKSPVTKKTPPPPPPPSRRQKWPFSDHPLAYKLWDKFTNRNSAPAITKSWIPTATTTRCVAHHNQPPQLRHVATGPPRNPTPHPHNRYLRDITEATSEMPYASHWCILRHSPAARLPNPAPALRLDPLGPKLQLSTVSIGPDGPSSGLVVRYAAPYASGPYVYWRTGVEVWHECATPDPFDPRKKPMEFTSIVRFRGNYYAMSLQGALAVMQVSFKNEWKKVRVKKKILN